VNLSYVKALAQTGDLLVVHGTDLVQRGIEEATRSPFCHIALLARPAPDALLVCEMVEGVGYQSMTIDDWFAGRPTDKVFFGRAPDQVRQGGAAILGSLAEYNDPERRKYGYPELFAVWLSGLTGKTYDTPHEVCSLFAQHRWQIAGYVTPGCAAPGDFLYFCESLAYIKP
jgi:hypothetical protein